MKPRSSVYRYTVSVAMVVLGLGILVATPSSTWAGPYLQVRSLPSNAGSTKHCQRQAAKALSGLKTQIKILRVNQKRRLGSTKNSTMYVDCIMVGQNQRRAMSDAERQRQRWVFYVSLASTSNSEAKALLKRLTAQLAKYK